MNETGWQLMTRIDYVKSEMKVFFSIKHQKVAWNW